MIQIRFVEGRGEGFESCLALRIQVFVEELGVDSAPQDDEWDAMAAHALLLDEKGEAVATARLYPEDLGWKVGRVWPGASMRSWVLRRRARPFGRRAWSTWPWL